MQLHKIVVEGSFGHLYRLHLPYEDPIHNAIEPKDFWDPVSARTFVWRLQVNDEKWLRILCAAGYPPDRHVNKVELRGAAIKLLVLGIINIYPLTHLRGFVQRARYLNINVSHGVQYHFIPSTLLVVQELPEVRFFKSEPESATQFIEQLALTDEQLADVICDLPLPFGLKSPERTTRITGLVHALCNGDVAVVMQHPNMTPPRKNGPEELPIEYYSPKPMTLGPHEEPGYELPPSVLNRNVLFSSNELAGVERASVDLLNAVGQKRAITFAEEGSDALRFLDYRNAEAAAFGAEDILLRTNPSKAAILEEFLHGTQQKLGIVDDIGRAASESHVKDFMIRHQRMLGLNTEDVRRLQILKDMGL